MSTFLSCMHVKAVVLHPTLGSKSGGLGKQLVEREARGAAGCGLTPGDKSEQEYLLALSAQYEVEHYEDCYDVMGSFQTCYRANIRHAH